MKKPFEVGDKINVYGFDCDDANKILNRNVVEICDNGLLQTDAGEFVHPRQCRRVIVKARREWEVRVSYKKGTPYFSILSGPSLSKGTALVVREVLEKK